MVEGLPHCVVLPSVVVHAASLDVLWESCVMVFLRKQHPFMHLRCWGDVRRAPQGTVA